MKKFIDDYLGPILLGVIFAAPFIFLICGVFCGTFFDCETDHVFHDYRWFSDTDGYFCPECGDQIKDLPVFCPSCDSYISSSFDFCPNCGGPLE